LTQQLWIVEHVIDLGVSLHQVLHLGIGSDQSSHCVRVVHHLLDHWIVYKFKKSANFFSISSTKLTQNCSHHLRIAHELVLHTRLHIHEGSTVGAKRFQARQAADLVESERCLTYIGGTTNGAFGFGLWWSFDDLKTTKKIAQLHSQRLKCVE
jgi:hypothetical protein